MPLSYSHVVKHMLVIHTVIPTRVSSLRQIYWFGFFMLLLLFFYIYLFILSFTYYFAMPFKKALNRLITITTKRDFQLYFLFVFTWKKEQHLYRTVDNRKKYFYYSQSLIFICLSVCLFICRYLIFNCLSVDLCFLSVIFCFLSVNLCFLSAA